MLQRSGSAIFERGLVKRVNTWFLSKEKFQQNLIKKDEINNTPLNKKGEKLKMIKRNEKNKCS